MFFHVHLICDSISRISHFHLFSNLQTIQHTQIFGFSLLYHLKSPLQQNSNLVFLILTPFVSCLFDCYNHIKLQVNKFPIKFPISKYLINVGLLELSREDSEIVIISNYYLNIRSCFSKYVSRNTCIRIM